MKDLDKSPIDPNYTHCQSSLKRDLDNLVYQETPKLFNDTMLNQLASQEMSVNEITHNSQDPHPSHNNLNTQNTMTTSGPQHLNLLK